MSVSDTRVDTGSSEAFQALWVWQKFLMISKA